MEFSPESTSISIFRILRKSSLSSSPFIGRGLGVCQTHSTFFACAKTISLAAAAAAQEELVGIGREDIWKSSRVNVDEILRKRTGTTMNSLTVKEVDTCRDRDLGPGRDLTTTYKVSWYICELNKVRICKPGYGGSPPYFTDVQLHQPQLFAHRQLKGQSSVRSWQVHCGGSNDRTRETPKKSFDFFIGRSLGSDLVVRAKITGDVGEEFEVKSAGLTYTNFEYAAGQEISTELKTTCPDLKEKRPMWVKFATPAERWLSVTLTSECSHFGSLSFDIVLQHDRRSASGQSSVPELVNHDNSFTAPLLFSKEQSDLTIFCGGKEYPAHKFIISRKSSVLRQMFSQPMLENLTGRLEIDDFEPEIVQEFLRFLYNWEFKNLIKNATGIFVIADKYDVQGMRALAERTLLVTMNAENVVERYGLGKLLNSEGMVAVAKEMIQMDKKLIWKTKKDFVETCKEFPELLLEDLSIVD